MARIVNGKVITKNVNGRIEVFYDWEMIKQSTWRQRVLRMIKRQ